MWWLEMWFQEIWLLQGIYTKGRVRSMRVVWRNDYEKELDSTIKKIYSFIRVLFRSVLLSRNRGEKSIYSAKREETENTHWEERDRWADSSLGANSSVQERCSDRKPSNWRRDHAATISWRQKDTTWVRSSKLFSAEVPAVQVKLER